MNKATYWKGVNCLEKEIKKWECIDCEIEFKASLKEDGFLPDCPRCGIDYRVFEIK